MVLNKAKNQIKLTLAAVLMVAAGLVDAQDSAGYQTNSDEIRWKSESQVRAMLGEPNSIQGPIGTHATYELWKYDQFTVAFSNKHAFHLFDKNSLHTFELNENRPQ